jgi:glycosyltransferase involved in cell wall biosynthesis
VLASAIRVLHVINSIAPTRGGPTYVVVHLARALSDLGARVEVVSTRADLDDAGEAEVRRALGGVALSLVGVAGPRRLELAPALTPLLWRTIGAADVVHVHTVFTFPVALAALLARTRRVPFVLRPAGTLDAACLGLRSKTRKRLAIEAYVRPSLRAAAAVQATSCGEAHELRALEPRANVTLVEVGVSAPTAVSLQPSGARRVGYLGRLHPVKRLEVLIDAIARLPDSELALAGAGDPAYVASLRARAAPLGARVRFHGHVADPAKTEFLASCDALAFPSLHESFGVAVAEAMAAGRPVVVSPEVGLSDEIAAADAGLVAPADPASLAAALAALLDDEAGRARRGAAARALVTARFGWDAIARKTLRLYHEAVQSSTP